MSEYTIGYIAIGSLLGLVGASLLYMAGGRKNKGIRRFGASFIIALTVCVSSWLMGVFSFFLLFVYPLKYLEFVQGYGDDDLIPKIWKRIGIALTSVFTGAIVCLILGGGWWLLIPHTVVGLGSVWFAYKNPIYASAEEPLICFLNNLVFIFYPFLV